MSGRLCSKDIKSDRCMCVYGSNNGKQEGRQAGRRRGSSHKNALFYNEKRTKSRANEERFFQRLFPPDFNVSDFNCKILSYNGYNILWSCAN